MYLEKALEQGQGILLEVNGVRLAALQSCRCRTLRETRRVEEVGAAEAAARLGGGLSHYVELTRLLPPGRLGDGVDFHPLENFTLVVVKPDCRIVYSGCEWMDISEGCERDGSITQRVTVAASRRRSVPTLSQKEEE